MWCVFVTVCVVCVWCVCVFDCVCVCVCVCVRVPVQLLQVIFQKAVVQSLQFPLNIDDGSALFCVTMAEFRAVIS